MKQGPLAAACLLAAGCVTESLSVCINCNNFTVARLQGGFTVTLTASTGVAAPCDSLEANLARPLQWTGCFQPRGGTVDTVRGIIRLRFADSAGAQGAIEFLEVSGSADSALARWRSNCEKTGTAGCPVGAGTARWRRRPASPTR